MDGKPYVTIHHEDITLRKKSDQELDALRAEHWHADRVTRTAVLISSLSHELSQPLTAILSNAQAGLRFLARDMTDKQKYIDIFNDIVSDNKRAGEVIDALRIIMRRQKTERKAVDMGRVMRDVSLLLHSEMLSQGIEAVIESDAECLVHGDQPQLQQVILNLMINGIDAMRDKADGVRRFQLRVWRAPGNEIRIDVTDTGKGITPEERDKLFDAFWTTKPQGTGMGLAICRSIIESHDGRIWMDAKPGSGSTFFIALPALAVQGMSS